MGVSALRAAATMSENFNIPFAFQVQNHTMPAGEYRIQQEEGESFATLVNTRTGARIQMLRPANTHQQGKARLVFEGGPGRPSLTRIF
jgi:hypothetical protein